MAPIRDSKGAASFGADPAAYHAARPPYPPELFDWLRETRAVSPGVRAFEIGAGTGLATAPILELSVGSLLAIEPDGTLLGYLRRSLPDPRIQIVQSPFEAADLPAQAFDFGFAATSFHWLARGKALAKVRAALRPGGAFAMWWHVFHDPREPDAFDRAAAHLFDGLEQVPSKRGTEVPFGLDAAARLGELRRAGLVRGEQRVFEQEMEMTPDQLAALYASISRIARLPPEDRSLKLQGLRRVADDFGGVVPKRVITAAYVAFRPVG
jgi:SAM-dependent methyltransferase